MTTSINNTDDFLHALRDNEEFQSAARRELLTEDLLEMPGELRELRKESNDLRKTQNSILEEQKELRSESNALRETQNSILDTPATLLEETGAFSDIHTDIRALHNMYRTSGPPEVPGKLCQRRRHAEQTGNIDVSRARERAQILRWAPTSTHTPSWRPLDWPQTPRILSSTTSRDTWKRMTEIRSSSFP